MKVSRLTSVLFFALAMAGCSTTVTTKTGHGNGGVPYYLPKLVLHVKESIEVKRKESLYAIVQIGGMSQYLYPMGNDMNGAIQELRELANIGAGDIKFIPLPKKLTIATEETQEIDDSENIITGEHASEDKTKKNTTTGKFAAITSNQTGNSFNYKPADTSKAYEVFSVPDTSKPFELFIENTGLVDSEVNFTLEGGWNLSTVGVSSDSTAAITAISSIAESIIGSQKEIEVAEISKSQELELEKLKQEGVAGDAGSAQSLDANNREASFSVLGYIREVRISSIKPGIYSLDDPANVQFVFDSSVIWQPISI